MPRASTRLVSYSSSAQSFTRSAGGEFRPLRRRQLRTAQGIGLAPLIIKHVIEYVRENIGPVASFKTAVIVKRLPKTRSGKILRSTMRKIANSEAFTMPPTIDDPAILDEIRDALQTIGYAKTS